VGELLGRSPSGRPRIQAKLTVNAPGDEYEREADRVAWQVMHMPADRATNVEEDDVPVVTPVSAVQRSGEGAFELDGDFERQLAASRPGGQPLPPAIRQEFEPRFGADFSEVRVHADAQSDVLNRSVGARALTNGQDIFFRQGAYAPGSEAGRALLAHELTHVEQQGAGGLNRRPGPAGLAAARIQAKWDFQNPDFNRTQRIEPLKKDFLVLKLTDDTGDTCILKGQAGSKSASLEHLTQEFASAIMPSQPKIEVAIVTSHWSTIKQAINRCMNTTDAPIAIASLGGVLTTKGLQTGHLRIMSVAPGEATSAVVPRHQTILGLFNNEDYLRDLGRLAALDVYTMHTDRVFSGNLGNWMSDVAGGRVSALIDNADPSGNVRYFLGKNGDPLDELSNGKIKEQTSAADAKYWALNYAIDAIFTIGLLKGVFGGQFDDKAAARAYLYEQDRDPTTKTKHYHHYLTYMREGWADAVEKLKRKVKAPRWATALKERIEEGGETVPGFLIEQLKLRNKHFLGVT
jgi:hypothetical protein